jgi:hypothetical protein
MINNNQIAQEISQLMLEYGAKLDGTVAKVGEHCSTQEFEAYRDAVGKVMGHMLFEIMNPLYEKHPNLKPKELE